ncbi:MAG: molybdopterin molybdenumtransferase MoeA [Chloroflexi bacterium]|nr:molybdopterin molybdenumtransferase MoeA [Chloroflexota bacterium]MBK7181119.1 molybdopterin molybdenumtransferase MoeA [Chloroflexota bacterium]
MSEFFNVLPPDQARDLLLRHLTAVLPSETIPTATAVGRITAKPLRSSLNLPAFRRSTMDGYAVRAADTYGASESLPAFLTVIGEVPMGQNAAITLQTGQAVLVHTGGMIPQSADAVVQIEHTQSILPQSPTPNPHSPLSEIEVLKAVAVGQNVLQIGEDVAEDEEILPAGHRLRPQDLGGLLAVGITELPVARQPRVGILATGDEVVHPSLITQPGQVRDINSYTVSGQIIEAGGIPVRGGIIPDNYAALETAAAKLLAECDMLVFSAGSSVSARDMTARVIDGLGKPGVLLHGVATRPGKPTIVGAISSVRNGKIIHKPVLGLPGNPVSAMIQFDMFGIPAIYWLQGLKNMPRRGRVWARLSQNVPSESGREDYVPARLADSADGLIATPVFGKSNLIYTLVNADGLIKVPLNKAGLETGDWVEVRLF